MRQYEILEHRGDFKIRAFGKTKEELFLNALFGMEAGFRPDFRNPPAFTSRGFTRHPREVYGFRKSRDIKVSSPDLNALLVDFLSEVLYLIQINKEIYDSVKFIKFTDTELQAELSGKKVERFGEDIKAVTYHGIDIRQGKDKIWRTTILFDI